MSIEQNSIAGPPDQRAQDPEEANEVHRLLASLESWVNLPRIMLETGVTERHQIPVDRLRYEASNIETMRLRHRAGGVNGPTYPQSTGTSARDEDEPDHLAEVLRSVGINRSENPPLKLDQVATNTQMEFVGTRKRPSVFRNRRNLGRKNTAYPHRKSRGTSSFVAKLV